MGFFDTLINGQQGKSASNLFNNQANQDSSNQALGSALNYQGSTDALDPRQSSRTATSEVQGNGILGGTYGAGGTLDQTRAEEQNLANRGFSLKPEDYEAYGQGSGNIAREFDASEGNLAQALSNRGLSSSGVAGQAFVTSQGNKMEQLGQLQRQIANDRMQSNLQRLGQTRNFMSQLNQQGQQAINDQYGRQTGSEKLRFGENMDKANLGENYMSDSQNQQNNAFNQQNATQQKGLAGALSSGITSGIQAAPGALMQKGAGALLGA